MRNSLKSGGPAKTASPKLHKRDDYTSPANFQQTIQAEINGRTFGKGHTEVFLIAADALEYIEPSEHVSDAQCLTYVFDSSITPELYSWPVSGLPVALALGPQSLGIELRFIQTLRAFKPSLITTHLNDHHGWHGPYNHERFPALGLVA